MERLHTSTQKQDRDYLIYDVNDSVQRGARNRTRHVPALTRGTAIHGIELRRSLLGVEALEVIGFPYFVNNGTFPFATPFASLVSAGELTEHSLRLLMGNSMHAAAVGSVIMVALGCTAMV